MYKQIRELTFTDQLKINSNHETNLEVLFKKGDKNRFMDIIEDMGASFRPDNRLGFEYCHKCGERIRYQLNGDTLLALNSDSCFQEAETVVEIEVPSGQLMFSDWPKHGIDLFRHLDDLKVSINSDKGVAHRIHGYAKENLAHFFVGNSSPSIFQDANCLYIGNEGYDEQDKEIPFAPSGVDKGRVITDLWWTTVVDRDTYLAHATAKFGKEKAEKMTIEAIQHADVSVQVEPGIYELRYFTAPGEPAQLYATLKKTNKRLAPR